ncbi:uncharacterized protein E0L32_006494 [Thyridium curvatum]|uniref:TPR domain protein n=1 Tax=Thyridium curvatum TaxID=1093900 RepID=A0A507B8G2_9PEZI|nr:uncharacterized protein E0L32_006494 [Thyridium curvatum]TPX13068.1 hypothetical protein E0L32_006494 [Thyridium curvatum]
MAVTLESRGVVPASDDYYNIGVFERRVSTTNNDAQVWFNRGLTWAYSFNHREAYACFKQVIAHDPVCVMGYWGAAFALGPNHNKVWGAFDKKELEDTMSECYDLVQKGKEAPNATPAERALVEALQSRFPSKEPPADLAPSVRAYADAMRQVYRRFGKEDLDIRTLAADALMGIAPWKLYFSQTGEPDLSTPVLEVKDLLEEGLKDPDSRRHPGLLHMYIHLTEMSKTPELAVIPADYLRQLVPEAGHISHMPSHIDVLVGDYRRAVHTNIQATTADDKYVAREGANNFYSVYRMHNYHSLIYAAMLAGHRSIALESVTRMEATLTYELLRIESPPMADWLEFFKSVRVHVYIRFGMWDALKELPIPEDKEVYCCTVAFIYYGKAIAYAATSDLDSAAVQRELYLEAVERVPPTRLDFPNRVIDTLGVATAMLDGELEYRRGHYDAAFGHLRTAVERDDGLAYSEPWAWMLPTRHPYAALLLERGRVAEAASLYAEDLGYSDKLVRGHQHPNNVWALHGYHECLVRLGRAGEAAVVAKQLSIAAAGADVSVNSSCFCRLETAECAPGHCS